MFKLIESLIWGFIFFSPIVQSCGGWTPPSTTTSAGQVAFVSDCDSYVDTTTRTEYQDYLGKWTVLWYGAAYSSYFREQIGYAVDYTCGLSLDQVVFVFINMASYSEYFNLLEDEMRTLEQQYSNCHSVDIVQAIDNGEWNWADYRGQTNTARIIDPDGFFADYYGSYGSRHSSLASNAASIKTSINAILSGTAVSPCAGNTTPPPTTHTLEIRFSDVDGGCASGSFLQLSEISFYATLEDATNQNNRIFCTTIDDSLGDSPASEVASRANDNDLSTKWLDRTCDGSRYICGLPSLVQYYRFTAANDAPERDPTAWSISLCSNSDNSCITADEEYAYVSGSISRRTVYPVSFEIIATDEPTLIPTTEDPTFAPTTEDPTMLPTYSIPTEMPTATQPSSSPTPIEASDYTCQTGYGTGVAIQSVMVNSYILCAASCDANAVCGGFDYTTDTGAAGESCRLYGIDAQPQFDTGGPFEREYCDSNEQFVFVLELDEVRECTSGLLQLSEVLFYQNGVEVACSKISVIPENSPSTEVVSNLVDGSASTKWLQEDYTCKMDLTVSGKLDAMPDSYTLRTANDYYARDPVSWDITICAGSGTQCDCDSQVNVEAPNDRRALYDMYGLGPCETSAPTDEPTSEPMDIATVLPETTKDPSRNPTISPTVPAPSHSPLPFPEGDIVTLKRRVEDLQDRVEMCVEKLDAILGVEAILQECQANEYTEAVENPFDYKSETWYTDLKATSDITYLTNADFAEGTYQITSPGRYVLTEDIVFDPNPNDDGFPPFHDPRFPMNKYFLGFFAAVTIETSDVWFDLNGFSFVQSLRHNTLQRFYNHIELADRVFIKFEGMASLNYQTNDKMQYNEESSDRHGSIKSASRVIISDGTFGRSSHNAVHGNGASSIVFENLNIIDFEVAGIQVNGGDNIAIVDCQIGPSNADVLFSAQWSNGVVLKHYFKRFIPYSLQKFGQSHLLNEEVTFADRPSETFTYQEVFDALITGVDAYTEHVLEGTEIDQTLAKMFNNTQRLPDGSAIYGIFLHRLGLGAEWFAAQDENYLGPEHQNVLIRNVVIRDLQIAPKIIPSLVFNDGSILQGPARDVVQFLTMTQESFLLGFPEATYKGNIMGDAYTVMALLSEKFYRAYVYDSFCGNFASNVTSSYLRNDRNCSGTFITPTLSGRDIHMLQKRIFGGLKISQRFLDWTTIPGTTLETLLKTEAEYDDRRQTKHNIVCYHDALFHPNKGIAAVRLEFMENVLIDGMEIVDLYNSGDADHWLCQRKYRLYSTQEEIMPMRNQPGRHMGPDVRGFAIGKSENVEIHNVNIDNLRSLEGAVFGFNIGTDTSDRSDYDTPAVSLDYSNIKIGTLIGGAGNLVQPYASQLMSGDTGEISIAENSVPEKHFEFDNAKLNIVFHQKPLFEIQSAEDAEEFLARYEVDENFMYDLNRQYQKFMRITFGLLLDFDYSLPWWMVPEDPEGKWRIVNAMQLGDVYFVCRKNQCKLPSGTGQCRERYLALIPNEEFVVYGTYGGTHGKTVYPGEFLLAGHYRMDGVTNKVLDINYFGECPLSHTTMMYDGVGDPHRISYMQNCAVQSEELGVGISIGMMGGFCSNDAQPGFFETGFALMTFDDHPDLWIEEEDYGAPEVEDLIVPPYPIWVSVSDGVIPITAGRSGILSKPYTLAYHKPNEAALKYFQKWLSFTDDEIRAFRHEALEFFFSHQEVPSVKVDQMTLEPLDNSIDLGGGNAIIPYTVTDAAEHHLVGRRSSTGADMTNARIHEVGFALNVGRAGIWTYAGHIEYGGIIQYGYYIVENEDGTTEAIKFYDHYPQVPNSNAHYTVVQRIIHPEYGYGLLHGLAKTMPTQDGQRAKLEFRYNWKWE